MPKSSLASGRIPPLEDVKHDVESPGLLPHAAWPKVPGKVGTVKPVELLLKVAATKVVTISKSISSTPPPSRKRRSTLLRGIESHPPRCIPRRGGGTPRLKRGARSSSRVIGPRPSRRKSRRPRSQDAKPGPAKLNTGPSTVGIEIQTERLSGIPLHTYVPCGGPSPQALERQTKRISRMM